MTGYTRFCYGRAPIMRLIQWRTQSKWGHVEHVLRDGSTIRAWFPGGVQHLPSTRVTAWEAEWRATVPMTGPQADALEAFLLAQVGRRYDWFALVGLAFGQNWSRKGRWFCSRLEDAAYEAAGLDLKGDLPTARCTPALLATSPAWQPVP